MDVHARNEYMEKLKELYFEADKKEKGRILDEYCRNTEQNRKYIINKFWKEPIRKQRIRKPLYDGAVVAALARCWEIFDSPCGQRLSPSLKSEVDRLRKFGELQITDEIASKLKKISPKTIDRRLRHHKEVLQQKRKYHQKKHSLLYHKIPVRCNDWDTSLIGQFEIDLVEHCGASAAGEFIYSLSAVDIASGWWEGQASIGRGQERTFNAIDKTRGRTPFKWREIHPDNDTAFINHQLFKYTVKETLVFSRSRPYHKNDNCFVEQKNSTHVRGVIGYLRHDTMEELEAINDLYENELRLYKNFFQPVMKLTDKTREKGKIHRKYDIPKTPFQRLIGSKQVPRKTKAELKALYETLNPAELKRKIDKKLEQLYEIYKAKKQSQNIMPDKKLKPIVQPTSVRFYLTQRELVRLGV